MQGVITSTPTPIAVAPLHTQFPPRTQQILKTPSAPTLPLSPIGLTANERPLFDSLKQFGVEFGNVTLRVAGGWVRDKLLGRQCSDIDIVIDIKNLLGFVTALRVWWHRKFSQLPYVDVSSPVIGGVQRHCLTAQITSLFGFSVDFTYLRDDNYDLGTPTLDAELRDFTVNSLYYNLSTEKIEDMTGMGMSDLRSRSLQCYPRSAVELLHANPRRIIRALRLACNLDFTIHSEVIAACRNSAVHNELRRQLHRWAKFEIAKCRPISPRWMSLAKQCGVDELLRTYLLLPR